MATTGFATWQEAFDVAFDCARSIGWRHAVHRDLWTRRWSVRQLHQRTRRVY